MSRRLSALVNAVVGLALVIATFLGIFGRSVFVFVAPALGLVWWFVARRRSGLAFEGGWRGGALGDGTDRGLAVPPGPPRDRPSTPPGRAAVIKALARFEAAELLVSGWFVAGLAIAALLVFGIGFMWTEDSDKSWWTLALLVPTTFHPLCGFTVIAVHRAVTRARRDGCTELFDSFPVGRDDRLTSVVATAWLPAAIGAAFAASMLVAVGANNANIYGPVDAEVLSVVAYCAVLGAGAVALGATVGRWVPFVLSPVIAVIAVPAIGTALGALGGPRVSPMRFLATTFPLVKLDPLFFPRPVLGRLVWIAGVTVVLAGAALLGLRPRARLLLAGGVALAVVGVAVTLRPVSGESTAAMIAEPLSAQACQSLGGGAEVCAYRPYGGHATLIAREVRPVVANMPAGTVDGVRLMHALVRDQDELPAKVVEELDGRTLSLPQGGLHLRFSTHESARRAAAFRLAAHAVGLPVEVRAGGKPTVVAGQARGILVLWLATRGLPVDDARDWIDVRPDPAGSSGGPDRPQVWPGGCFGESDVLAWSDADVRAGVAIVGVDEQRVRSALHADWARFIDPATTTDELLAALGLDPVGPPGPVDDAPSAC